MPGQTYAGLSNVQRSTYERMLIERALPYMPMFGAFGGAVKTTIPDRGGTTAEWRSYGGATVATTGAGLALAMTALTEGAPPTVSTFAVAKVTKQVSQYGAYVMLSDLLTHNGIDRVWTEATVMLGEQAGQTLHALLVNDLVGGTNVQFAGAAANRAGLTAAMVLSGAELREAVRTLTRAKQPRFGDGYYHALAHPDALYDLKNDADWKNMNVYQGGAADGGNSMITGKVGALHGVLFEESTDAPTFAIGVGGATVPCFGTLVFGPRWFATLDLSWSPTPSVDAKTGRGIEVDGVPVGTATKDDPLGQYGVLGWKTSYAGKVLREWAGLRIESGATAG